MMNEPLAHGAVIGILAMAAATLLTRVSGYWLMGHIPMTRRVRRSLAILPGALLAAAGGPLFAENGAGALVAPVLGAPSIMGRPAGIFPARAAIAPAPLARGFPRS